MTTALSLVLVLHVSLGALALLWWGCCRRDRDRRQSGIKRH